MKIHFEFFEEGSGPIGSAPHLIQLGRVDVNQACAQQPSQMDCNIRLPHPTRTIQKLAENLFGENEIIYHFFLVKCWTPIL